MVAVQFASVLLALLAVSNTNATPTKLNRNTPEHASLLSEEDAVQLGRLARLINFAQCPSERHIQPIATLSNEHAAHATTTLRKASSKLSAWTQPKETVEFGKHPSSSSARQWGPSGLEFGSDVVYTSHEVLKRGERKGKKLQQAKKVVENKKKNGGYVIAKPVEDLEWLISHNPQTSSLTLAMSSLPTAESFLALIEEQPLPLLTHLKQHAIEHRLNDNPMLVELPSVLFPNHLISQYTAFSGTSRPMMHSALLGPLLKHGPAILVRLLELIDSPPEASSAVSSKRAQGTKLVGGIEIQLPEDEVNVEIHKVTISGHGLGADLAALIALSLQVHMLDPVRIAARQSTRPTPIVTISETAEPSKHTSWLSKVKRSNQLKHAHGHEHGRGASPSASFEIDATFFGMSRIGNRAFASWVDALIEGRPELLTPDAATSAAAHSASHHHHSCSSSAMKFTRVSSYADLIPHLPSAEHGFQHFSSGEVWVDGDPRTVWSCSNESVENGAENTECTNSVTAEHASLLDHAGPYFDVWVGSELCA